MSTYRNGQIPAHLLIKRDVISLTAGTWAKWDHLVQIVKERYGATLTITRGSGVTLGSGGYRDAAFQKKVKQKYIAIGKPGQAAAVGKSSHGGEFNGEDALAIDVSNWALIGQAAFFAAAREAGFVAGYFNGKGGRPNEPWHLIDKDPYRTVGAVSGGGTPFTPTPVRQEDDEMLMLKITADGATHLCSLGNGVFRHLLSTDPYEWIKNVARSDDEWTDVPVANLPALLRTYGCDLNIWEIKDGEFRILDPLTGIVSPGQVWTATNALRATVARAAK